MEHIAITKIKRNPENPRIITDDKFQKLVKSIKDFPKMLEMRPIVVNTDMVVLGGNMRLKACKKAGLKKVPYMMFTEEMSLSMNEANGTIKTYEEHCKEFVIKDNSSFGEWEWSSMLKGWEKDELTEWGIDVPTFGNMEVIEDVNNSDETEEWIGMPEFEPKEKPIKLIIGFDSEEHRAEFVEKNKVQVKSAAGETWITRYPYGANEDLTSIKYEQETE